MHIHGNESIGEGNDETIHTTINHIQPDIIWTQLLKMYFD